MRLVTLKRRYIDIRTPKYVNAIETLIKDGVWNLERAELLSTSLTTLYKHNGARRIQQFKEYWGNDFFSKLPEWVKMTVILKEPALAEFLGPLSENTIAMWNLVK